MRKNELGKHFCCQSNGSTLMAVGYCMCKNTIWVSGGVRVKIKVIKRKCGRERLLIKWTEKSVKWRLHGEGATTPCAIWLCSSGSLLSDCQGQFHLSLTFPALFTLAPQSACIKQAIRIIIKLFMPAPVNPIAFSPSLLSLLPSFQTDFPSVYLSFPSVTRDINIFFLLGLIGFWLRWYNIRPSSLWRWSLGLEYWVYFLNMCFGSVFALVALPAVFPILSLRKVLTMNSSWRFNEEDILYYDINCI